MSQQLKEFVKQSGVEVQSIMPFPSSTASNNNNNNNNNLAREIEANMLRRQEFPNRLEKNMMSNANYNEFSDAVNSPNYNNLPNENKKMINNVLREFEPPASRCPGSFY
jgi:short-subunit dehydrogenase